MGSVTFILYFTVNGISSNIKWRMSAVWEKQKNQYKSRLHMREARSWGCQALQSLLGQTTRARQWAKTSTRAKLLLWKQAVPWASCTLCPTTLPPVCKEGVSRPHLMYRHMGCMAVSTALLPQLGSPTIQAAHVDGVAPVQIGWAVFFPGCPWGEIREGLRNERRNGKPFPWTQEKLSFHRWVSTWAGAMPRLRCGQTHTCLKNYTPKRDGVRGRQVEQWSRFLQLVRNTWQSPARLGESVTHILQEHNDPVSHSAISQQLCQQRTGAATCHFQFSRHLFFPYRKT